MTRVCVSWNILNSKKVQFVKRIHSRICWLICFQLCITCPWTMFLKNKILCLYWKNTTWFSSMIELNESELICLFLGTTKILKRKAPVTGCFSSKGRPFIKIGGNEWNLCHYVAIMIKNLNPKGEENISSPFGENCNFVSNLGKMRQNRPQKTK